MPAPVPSDPDNNPSDDLTNSLFNGLLHVQDPITKVQYTCTQLDQYNIVYLTEMVSSFLCAQ